MATVIRQIESLPAEYPTAPVGLSSAVAALVKVAWQRIEPYIAWRFSPRAVTWIVEGPGEWLPPLKPATISGVEIWSGPDEWEAVTAMASPLGGYCLPATGPYRFTATVGSEVSVAPPGIVQEAVKRLAEYLAAEPDKPGATSERTDIPGVINMEVSRLATWRARAMQNSGAADLLRPYRRA